MELLYSCDGIPELGANLDEVAGNVAGPITREGLEAGADIIRAAAQANIHSVTGAMAHDVIVVVRIVETEGERYALIGPGWDPENFRRETRRRGKYANEAPIADQTTNPGLYGMFVELGHRAPEQGLAHDLEYKRAAYAARKLHQRVNTAEFGNLTTPPHPWLGPAFDQNADLALERAADVIRERLEGLHLRTTP